MNLLERILKNDESRKNEEIRKGGERVREINDKVKKEIEISRWNNENSEFEGKDNFGKVIEGVVGEIKEEEVKVVYGCERPKVIGCELPLKLKKFRKEDKRKKAKRKAKLEKIRKGNKVDVTKGPKKIKVVGYDKVKVVYVGFRKNGRKNNTVRIKSNKPIVGKIDEKGRIVEFGKDNVYYNEIMFSKSLEQMDLLAQKIKEDKKENKESK